MTDAEQKVIDEVNSLMHEALTGYIGDPLTPSAVLSMKKSIEDILTQCIVPHTNFSDYTDVTYDDETNIITIFPKQDAPEWVLDIFAKINNEN